MGPNEAMPKASIGSCWRKKRMTSAIVELGDAVGTCPIFRFSGPVPTPQMNLVPPASIAPNMARAVLWLQPDVMRVDGPRSGALEIRDGFRDVGAGAHFAVAGVDEVGLPLQDQK